MNIEEKETKRKIIEKLFPDLLLIPEEIEKKYPPRNLENGAMVTRIAPSPTGFMHIGSLYTALISERLAHQTKGVFYLRIEDTDKKREVDGSAILIPISLNHYGIKIDEGETILGTENGQYGPYKQSNRVDIYKAYVKFLVEKGLAYPCFDTNEELEEMRKIQEEQSIRTGYYKQWAKWRNRTDKDVLQILEEGREFIIRFKSNGDFDKKIIIKDSLIGERELSENDQDIVILKSDGLPTYHMAHVIDDHLMGTTHVLRGNEWLSSLPLHLQLFESMGWKSPNYGHIFPINKMEGSSKRKLSKRKDPEANVVFFDEQGYPVDAVVEYLLNLANSNFEDWRKANPEKNNSEFILTLEKLASSNGPLFDFVKLNDTSKEIIARYSAKEVYIMVLEWAKKYDLEFANLLEQNSEYTERILNIERNNEGKTRKDISKWSDVKKEIEFFFDQNFILTQENIISLLPEISMKDISIIVDSYNKTYNLKDTKDEWFAKIKDLAKSNGYAESTKDFKKNPEKYKGNVADVAKIFRVLLTGRVQTPDLYSIIQTMGEERVSKRLANIK